MEDYIDIKGVLTIERIKDIVAQIMSACQKRMKYQILETIMKGVIFQNKKLRESFMQEILIAADNATYKVALEEFININNIKTQHYFHEITEENGRLPRHERIIDFSQVDLNNTRISLDDKLIDQT